MFNLLKIRFNQGNQAIPDIRTAKINDMFRGIPYIATESADKTVESVCPTGAVKSTPLSIDMGKCIFCADCEKACKKNEIKFTNLYKMSSTSREKLIVNMHTDLKSYEKTAVQTRKDLKKFFGRSLKLRSVSAGGCNACEMELNACSNVNFDMGRFGIDIAPSPRHADGIIVTGPVSENMACALEDTYLAVPEPKIIILAGTCAISGGLFYKSPALNRSFIDKYKTDLFIPGCPVHPLTVINAVLSLIGA